MDDKFGFDGAFPNHIAKGGIILNDYNEQSKRMFAMELLNRYVPSTLSDPRFEEITQGRARVAKATGNFFSTCGELVMWLWHRMGYRGYALNRDITLPNGEKLKYKFGANMTYIRYRTMHEKLWIARSDSVMPNPGDILFISNGPARTEHVCVYKEKIDDEWVTYDAGQYTHNKLLQEAKIVTRKFNGDSLGERKLHGWVDLSKMDLYEPANLEVATG